MQMCRQDVVITAILPHVVQGTKGSAMAPWILRRVKFQLCSREGDKEVPHTKTTCCHHPIVAWRLCVYVCGVLHY